MASLRGFPAVNSQDVVTNGRVDIHSTAIASAANVGGAASAPVVAAHHNPKLVPVSILMALTGYAVGTYGALDAAWLCRWVAGV